MEIKAQNIVIEPIEKLVEDPKNENVHSERQIKALAKIISINGFRSPVVVSNRTGLIVAGHGRLTASKLLGMTEIPVIYQDFENEADELRHRLADNEISRYAELDTEKMLGNLKELDIDLESFDFGEIGLLDFDMSDLDKINQVNSGDENSEWVGMPEFKEGEKEFKIMLYFKNELHREEFASKHNLHKDREQNGQWIIHL